MNVAILPRRIGTGERKRSKYAQPSLQLIDIDVINFNEGNLRKAMRALERADCDHRLMNMESNRRGYY